MNEATGAPPVADPSRSEAGGWSGHGYPQHGDFVRPRPSGNVHIAERVTPYNSRHARVELSCGAAWSTAVLDPADGDQGRQCQRCHDSVGWSLATDREAQP